MLPVGRLRRVPPRPPAEDRGDDERPVVSPSRTVLVLAALIAVEGVGLIGVGVFTAIKTAVSKATSVGGALWAAVLAAAFGAVLIWLATAVARHRRWSRSPVVVIQIVLLPVGFSVGIQAHQVPYGVPILVLAVAILALFASPEARGIF